MESSGSVVLNNGQNRYELVISESASLEQYEGILSLIMSRLETRIIDSVNDFDNYYQSFFCLNEKVVVNFSYDFGVRAFLLGDRVDLITQKKVLAFLDNLI